MDGTALQKRVLRLLENFRGKEPLRRLFWSELNYDRRDDPLSRRGWPETISGILAEDPLIFASGGVDDGFEAIHCRLDSEKLSLEAERRVIQKLYGEGHDRALFIFSNSARDRWHFVNVRFSGDEGRQRLYRRITVGPEELLRTAAERISMLDLDGMGGRAYALDIQARHDEAFSVEAVTNEFFREYARVFTRIEQLVEGIADPERKRLFTQRLFNRLMFLAFIQKKGWLAFEDNNDYLAALWEAYRRDEYDENFYRDRLKHLFFTGLNNPHEVDIIGINEGGYLRDVIGNVPYLNGGLFERDEDDHDEAIVVPDEAISAILNELFSRFNFTVIESTPLDVEVAVDPEMLGRVFEELVTGRHEKGAYYTPKPVVSFMCREALKGYLGGYETLVDEQNSSNIGVQEARELLQRLAEVRIVDPACGSGAYLLGMLQELHVLNGLLDTRTPGTARDDYERKLEIIQNNPTFRSPPGAFQE